MTNLRRICFVVRIPCPCAHVLSYMMLSYAAVIFDLNIRLAFTFLDVLKQIHSFHICVAVRMLVSLWNWLYVFRLNLLVIFYFDLTLQSLYLMRPLFFVAFRQMVCMHPQSTRISISLRHFIKQVTPCTRYQFFCMHEIRLAIFLKI